MSLPATDAFTDTGGTELSVHNASWTGVVGGLYIGTNAVYNAASAQSIYYWNADTFSANQYCQLVAVGISSTATQWFGPACRVASGSETCYFFQWGKSGSAQRRYGKRVAGTNTVLGNDNTPASTSDVFRLECDGSTITAKINGGTWNSTTDSAITAADPAGIYSQGSGVFNLGDDLEAGNLAVAGASSPPARKAFRVTRGLIGR